jgi:CspA family cold shock protein
MLRKMLAFTVAVCAATVLMSANALAWGGGSWNRSGSASYTGRGGNTYSRSYSGSGSFSGDRYGGGGYHYGGGGYRYGGGGYRYGYGGGGGGYYAGGFHPGSFVAGYAAGAYYSQ